MRNIPGVRYAVTVNGGMLLDLQEDRVLDEKLLPMDIAAEIYDLLAGYHVMCDAYIQGQGFSERYCFEHMDEYDVPPVVQELVYQTRIPVDNIKEYIRERYAAVDKLNLFFNDPQERAEVRRLLEKRGVQVIKGNAEFTGERQIRVTLPDGPGAEKGEGLLRLARILGIKPEETMAFGDGENDFSMIDKAGIGIVMENGVDKLKKIADYIAPDNNDAGVGQMLEKLILSHS